MDCGGKHGGALGPGFKLVKTYLSTLLCAHPRNRFLTRGLANIDRVDDLFEVGAHLLQSAYNKPGLYHECALNTQVLEQEQSPDVDEQQWLSVGVNSRQMQKKEKKNFYFKSFRFVGQKTGMTKVVTNTLQTFITGACIKNIC